jgi:hypothetical protein
LHGGKVNIAETIEGLDSNSTVVLLLEDAREVFHFDGDYHDGLLEKTQFLEELTRAATSPGIREANDLLNLLTYSLKVSPYPDPDEELDDGEEVPDVPAEVLEVLKENPWDFVNEKLEMWDRKKGLSNLSARLSVPVWALEKAHKEGVVLDERWKAEAQ